MSKMKLLAGSVAFAAALATAAPAAAAVANTNVNVRATPGGTIVDVLMRGEQATIVGRVGGWCEVRKPGPDGYVACRYLSDGDFYYDDDDDDRDDRRVNADVSISFGIPGFRFSIGSGDFDRPGRPDYPRRGRVCFYEHVNYEGDRFCARPGDRDRSLSSSWNDTISSIRVSGGAEALVCEHFNYDGRCVVIDRDRRNLGRGGNDRISSYRIR